MNCTWNLFKHISSLRRNDRADESTKKGKDSMKRKDLTIDKYKLLKTIGTGAFAEVKLAVHEPTGKKVAIKIINKTGFTPDLKQKSHREARIMRMLEHPNIVKLFQVIETKKTFHIVMEYVSEGDLSKYLERHGRMEEPEARAKFIQIVSAVEYCHEKGIVHRDLKDSNILLGSETNIKVADFGLSNEFTPGYKLATFCGSPHYTAPEILMGVKYDGPEVDVWSLGVILFQLVTGTLPFRGSTLQVLKERVLHGKFRIPPYVSKDCENILKKLLVVDRFKRTSLEVLRYDKWLNQEYEMCTSF